jgi:hypothetical protein
MHTPALLRHAGAKPQAWLARGRKPKVRDSTDTSANAAETASEPFSAADKRGNAAADGSFCPELEAA